MVKVVRAAILAVVVALLLGAILLGFGTLAVVLATVARKFGVVGLSIVVFASAIMLLRAIGVVGGRGQEGIANSDEVPHQPSSSLLEIADAVHESCARLGMPRVPVFELISEDVTKPYLLAAAYPSSAAVGLSLDLKRLLNTKQLDAVIAHEFGHVVGAIHHLAEPIGMLKLLFLFVFLLGQLMGAAASLASHLGIAKAPPRSLAELLLPAALIGGVYLSATLVHWLEEFDADLYAGVVSKYPGSLVEVLDTFKLQDESLASERTTILARLAEYNLLPSHPPLSARIWLLKTVFSLRG